MFKQFFILICITQAVCAVEDFPTPSPRSSVSRSLAPLPSVSSDNRLKERDKKETNKNENSKNNECVAYQSTKVATSVRLYVTQVMGGFLN